MKREEFAKAKESVLGDDALKEELHRRHSKDKKKIGGEPDFNRWLADTIRFMESVCGSSNPSDVSAALKFVAMGDDAAKAAAASAKRNGFESGINCYVENGKVNSNVWLKGKTAESVRKEGDRIAATFRKAGYFAEVWVDDRDDTEVLVTSEKDFKQYLADSQKGGAK